MILKSLTIRGTYAFPEEITVDFPIAAIVAVAGQNGAGKTTLLDAIHMALYGRVPNRRAESGNDSGVIYDQFPARDGLVDLTIEVGLKKIRVRRLIDGPKRKQVPYLYVDDVAITEGKSKEFEEALAKVFPYSETMFLASAYATQSGKGSVLSLDEADCRGLLDDVLDLSKYNAPHSMIVAETRSLEAQRSQEKAIIDHLRSGLEDIKQLNERADQSRTELERLRSEETTKKQEIESLIQRLANLRANSQDVSDTKRKLDQAIEQEKILAQSIQERKSRIQKNQTQLLNRKDEIIAANAEFKESWALRTEAESKIDNLQSSIDKRSAALKEQSAQVEARLRDLQAEADATLKAVADFNAQKRPHEAKIAANEATLSGAKDAAGLLTQVPCHGTEMNNSCKLLGHARNQAAEIEACEGQIAAARKALASIDKDRMAKEALVAQIRSEIDSLRACLPDLDSDPEIRNARDQISALKAQVEQYKTRIMDLQPLSDLLPELEGAAERIKDYESDLLNLTDQQMQRTAEIAEYQNRLKDSEEAEALKQVEELYENAKSDLQGIESDIGNAERLLHQIHAQQTTTEKAMLKMDESNRAISAINIRLSRLQTLRDALGPKGVRALKVDAAGPGISETVNSLLRECYGHRFQVQITTQKETGKGDLREALAFSVLDNEKNTETIIQNKSGGEQAVIVEAISLGLALYKRQHSNADLLTLIRDETTAALTDENALLYLKMLRKAVSLGGFRQVLFVSHKTCLSELSDAIIRVGNGTATVSYTGEEAA